MTRIAPLLALVALMLMGQDCEDAPPPPTEPTYCAFVDPPVLDQIVDGAASWLNTIIGGEPSVDRRATVLVRFGQSYCTGVVVSRHSVLTAAHCGYAPSTVHSIYLDNETPPFHSTEHIIHPSYQRYLEGKDPYGRRSDLMIVHVAEVLPGPYAGNYYSEKLAHSVNQCSDVIAQGWGRTEEDPIPCFDNDGDGSPDSWCLRERGELQVHEWNIPPVGGLLRVEGVPCFGDSGGPTYTVVDGDLWLAGISHTTSSSDCLAGAHLVKVVDHAAWISQTIRK